MKSIFTFIIRAVALLGASGLLNPSHALANFDLEAKGAKVDVLKEASKTSAVIVSVPKGKPILGKDRAGMYWRVTVDGKEGFVKFTDVVRKSGGGSALTQALKEAAEDSRDMDGVKAARSRSTVMGVRGLDESAETASAGSVRANLRMVYAMEDRKIGEKRVSSLENLVLKEVSFLEGKAEK